MQDGDRWAAHPAIHRDVDFYVRHPEWGRLGYLGQCGADEAGPGLSWKELAILAEAAQNSSESPADSSQRLLLLLPMLGDVDFLVVLASSTDYRECGVGRDKGVADGSGRPISGQAVRMRILLDLYAQVKGS
ncbi:hypothetical protein OHA79_16810 [Streptomyces sp. NBC_00841]|uniref:hypothetical protein n=1 Tax=Streptomyces sp. NBC_00841 TaxID=2975847 RepID=UPI002DDACD20|nr:hypothetical protein [Streptomyces sp. NBC_00841]MCX4535343.1 hypothetical protein [Streptomyces sp. NBC_01669]WRZ99355.1 hypothetical protein OHA79_16810 [Streptomyces sp. NBC_00841]